LSNQVPKGIGRFKVAQSQATNAIGNLINTHLSDFLNLFSKRKGRQAAASTTAQKLAAII
jgi:hypothetical protein